MTAVPPGGGTPARAATVAGPAPATLRVLWSGQFVTTAGLTVVVPLLPLYLEDLGVGSSRQLWTGLALAAPSVTLALAAPLWGRLGDRWGRKPMVVRALVGLAGSLGAMAFVQTPVQLLAVRLVQGAFGGVVDAGAALAGSVVPPAGRGRALGRLQSSTAAGALVGPLAGGFLVDAGGLRPVLLVTAILTATCAGLTAMALREPDPATAPVPAVPAPRPPAGVAGQRRCALAGTCGQAGAFGIVAVIAPHVRRLVPDPSQTATGVGMLQGAMWAAALVGAPWWGGRTDRRRVDETLALALWGCTVAALVQAAAPRVSWLSAGRILQGFCFAAVAPSVLVGASRQAGPERQGTVIGTGAAFLVGGQVLGAVGGGLLSSIVSTSWTIAAMAVLFAAGAALARGGRRVGAGTACP